MTTSAEALLHRLSALGVEVVFGIPGVDNLAFFEALDRSNLRTVLVRHEATAGFAADAWFRIRRTPAVCFTTAGPGAANALTPMGEAWASGSTLLHLTTAVATAYGPTLQPRGLPHYHPDQLRQFEPLATLARRCDDPERLPDLAHEVISAMLEPPHAAGYLEVPFDLLSSNVGDAAQQLHPRPPTETRPVSDRDIHRAATLLVGAEKPLIWAGSGAVTSATAVIELAERLGAPVFVTHSAKRGFGHFDHPLVVAFPPHEPAIGELIESSDAVLVLGSDLDAMMTKQFTLSITPNLIHVDVRAEHIGMRYPAAIGLVSNVKAAVAAMTRDLESDPGRSASGRARASTARDETTAWLAADPGVEVPLGLLATLDSALPPDAIVVCDMAIAGYWAAGLLNLAPSRRLLYPIGWGTLGFGLPAAIGAAVAAPGARVLCIAGDAGLSYALGELATLVQERLPVTVLVVDDGGYGMLRFAAGQRFGREFATDLAPPDFAALGAAFGIPTWSASLGDSRNDAVVRASMELPGPSLVHLRGRMPPPRMALLGTPLPVSSGAEGHGPPPTTAIARAAAQWDRT